MSMTPKGKASGKPRDQSEFDDRRMLPYMLIHYGACSLQRLATEVLQSRGESSEKAHELLRLSRNLTQIIERRLFGNLPPTDEKNVVDLAVHKREMA